jgi:23S rRNA pseudouridine1911/1915/1917 synthase
MGESTTGQRIELVFDDEEPLRLDRWLAAELDEVASRETLQKWLKSGHVTVNGQVVGKPSFKPSHNDSVVICIPSEEPINLAPETIPLDIVFEDDHLLVVNKPSGMLTHPAGKQITGTLVNALLHHCNQQLSDANGPIRPGIVHRLDRDTSGLMVVAKTNHAHRALQAQFQPDEVTGQRQIKRTYVAITHGIPSAEVGTIEAPLGRNPKKRDAQMVRAIAQGGRHAVTHWRVLETGRDKFAKVEFTLETGRTHQIRVHCQHKGFPIVGDPLYGTGVEKQLNLPTQGQCLQAIKLEFLHPITNQLSQFSCQLTPVMEAVWKKLND